MSEDISFVVMNEQGDDDKRDIVVKVLVKNILKVYQIPSPREGERYLPYVPVRDVSSLGCLFSGRK